MEERTLECNHGDLEKHVRDLERQFGTRAPEQADLAEELEDTQAKLDIMWEFANEYQAKVTQILRLTEGKTGGGGQPEEIGSEIAHSSEVDRKELRGWQVQLALKIAWKPRTFNTKQKKLRYTVG
jgi:hypothetical protein